MDHRIRIEIADWPISFVACGVPFVTAAKPLEFLFQPIGHVKPMKGR
jgi:hypothetical protein